MPRGLRVTGGPGGGGDDHDGGGDEPGIRDRFRNAQRNAREGVRDGREDFPPAPELAGALIGATRGLIRNKVEDGLGWIWAHKIRTLIAAAILAAATSGTWAVIETMIRRNIPDCVEADGVTPVRCPSEAQ